MKGKNTTLNLLLLGKEEYPRFYTYVRSWPTHLVRAWGTAPICQRHFKGNLTGKDTACATCPRQHCVRMGIFEQLRPALLEGSDKLNQLCLVIFVCPGNTELTDTVTSTAQALDCGTKFM